MAQQLFMCWMSVLIEVVSSNAPPQFGTVIQYGFVVLVVGTKEQG